MMPADRKDLSPIKKRASKYSLSNPKIYNRVQWNGIDVLLLVFMVSMSIHSVSGFFSVPTQIIDVSTFDSISNIDNGTANVLDKDGNYSESGESITAIKLLVFGGEDDVAGDSGLDFFGYPPPSSVQGITSAPPQSTPCLNSATANCSTFVGADGVTTGPIKIQIRSTLPVFKYKLVSTKIKVPYAYLDHNAPVLYCPSEDTSNQKNLCSKAPAEYVSYDTNHLLNDYHESDIQKNCRGVNNANLGDVELYNRDENQDFITPGCFACPIIKLYGSYNDDGGSKTTTSHFCPFPVSHTPSVPIRDQSPFIGGDDEYRTLCSGNTELKGCGKNVYSLITADLASLEDYYYWCYGNLVGVKSNFFDNDGIKYSGPNGPEYNTNNGQFFDMVREHDTAYQCTLSSDGDGIDRDLCTPYIKAASVLDINSGTTGAPCYLQEEEPTGTDTDITKCSNSQLNQVPAAIRFLTASCDADDSAENMSPAKYKLPNDGQPESGYDFTCPGSQWGHVRPQIFNPTDGMYFARCSAGCSDKNTVVHASVKASETKFNPADYTVQTVMRQKGTVEVGPVMCDVYRLQSRPRAVMDVEIIITAPNGEISKQELSTDGFDFATTLLQDVKFSSRINRIEPNGAMGETLDGYIVICGTTENAKPECDGLDTSSPPYNLDNNGECDTPVLGSIRGVFPSEEVDDAGKHLPGKPTVNPWPNIINKMVDDFTTKCKKNLDECLKNGPNPTDPNFGVSEYASFKRKSCATPTPTYLSALNCGRRVSWYYVDEFNTQNYGSECGRLGFRNENAKTNAGAKFMCQQGDFTCTPGFGTPRYGTSAGSTRLKSPCQEQGALTRYNQESISFEGCGAPGLAPPLNLPPGWVWAPPMDTTPGGHDINDTESGKDFDNRNVPNMWIDGLNLYRELASNEASSINLEIEIYTNTFFGGSYQSFAPGEIVRVNKTYCDATVDIAQSGRLAVEFCNTSPDSGGSYVAVTICGFEDQTLQTPNTKNISITMDPVGQDSFNLGAKNCSWRQWTFSAAGPIAITEIWCSTTLSAGLAVGLEKLDEVAYSCDITIPKYVDLGKHAIYHGTDYQVCKGQGDFFCHLSQQPDWTQAILYVFFIGLYIVAIIYVINLVKAAWLTQKSNRIIEKETENLLKKRQLHDENTAKMTAMAINDHMKLSNQNANNKI